MIPTEQEEKLKAFDKEFRELQDKYGVKLGIQVVIGPDENDFLRIERRLILTEDKPDITLV